MKKQKLIIAGAILTVVIATGVVLTVRSRNKGRKQDEKYTLFHQKLTNAKEPEKIERAALQLAFDPTYWSETGTATISDGKAKELALKINDAWGFWDDLEDEIYKAFQDRHLVSFADVSKVAHAYKQKDVADRDLWEHLEYKLSTSEFANVKQIVSTKNTH